MDSLLINILVYNALAVAALLLIIFKNPRYMMQDYPQEIIKDVPEKTNEEKRGAVIFGIYMRHMFDYGFIGR